MAVAGLVPGARLWVLIPAVAYTLTGGLAVRRAAISPGFTATAALASFAIAEVAAILLATSAGPPGAWAAIMTLCWMGGVLLTTNHGNDQ
jgi:hypothetical protein